MHRKAAQDRRAFPPDAKSDMAPILEKMIAPSAYLTDLLLNPERHIGFRKTVRGRNRIVDMLPNFLKADNVDVFANDGFRDKRNFAPMLLKDISNISGMLLIGVQV